MHAACGDLCEYRQKSRRQSSQADCSEYAQGNEERCGDSDVAIDQGGCFKTPKATTHAEPTYIVDGVVHYCVANMPGAVARRSTAALTNVTLPYAVEIANNGWQKAMREKKEIKLDANIIDGKVTYQAVADACNLDCTKIDELLAQISHVSSLEHKPHLFCQGILLQR